MSGGKLERAVRVPVSVVLVALQMSRVQVNVNIYVKHTTRMSRSRDYITLTIYRFTYIDMYTYKTGLHVQ
ncbi:hypothetical protein CI610_03532 [invertebrate metagenome]|uniref:Uncharacterized protein n=1 Tax=invertebrate metagenome TaxID=1711999 RepID=A0A2H9T2W8_9ZZZZ